MTTCLGKTCSFGLLCVFRERLSICMCASFPSGFEDGMWDLIVLLSDNYLSFYLLCLTDISDDRFLNDKYLHV